MGDRITNGVNPSLLLVQISMLLVFAICINSVANAFTFLLFHVCK